MELKQRFANAGENPFTTWRKEQGLTKTEFARLLDVPYSCIYKLESGHYGVRLTDHLLHKMVKAKLPIDQLLPAYMRWRRGELPMRKTPGNNQNHQVY